MELQLTAEQHEWSEEVRDFLDAELHASSRDHAARAA
jgi:hypothetical protein